MNLPASSIPRRVAIAESADGGTAPLGKALRFMIVEIENGRPRHPRYRVRHDNPGECCGAHQELDALLADCDVVIASEAGENMRRRFSTSGPEIIVRSGPSSRVAHDWLPGVCFKTGSSAP